MRKSRTCRVIAAMAIGTVCAGALAQTTTVDFSGPNLSPTLVPYGDSNFSAASVNDKLRISLSYDGSQGAISDSGGVSWTQKIVGDYTANFTVDVSGMTAVVASPGIYMNGGPLLGASGGGTAFVGPWNVAGGTEVNGATFIHGNYQGSPPIFIGARPIDVQITRIGDQITESARPSGQGAFQTLMTAQGTAFLGTTNLQFDLYYSGSAPVNGAYIDYSNASVTELTSTVPEESDGALLVTGLGFLALARRAKRVR